MKDAENFLRSKLSKNDVIIIALSGGPDSMCLLNIVLKFKKRLNLTIIGAHVNHNVRKQSNDEKIFIEHYCEEKKIKFETMKIENYTNDNFHNEARLIRYEFFENLIKKYKAKYLMTAHHGDDLIETVLMRLTRGSTFKGYGGFEQFIQRDTYQILRPLISYSKKDIEAYNKEKDIPFVTDVSNMSKKYTRNRYRKEMLPFLKNEDENVHLKFLKFSETINEYNNYINKIIIKKMKKMYKDNILDLDQFNKLEDIEKNKTLELILDKIYDNDLALITTEHLNNIIKLIDSKKVNSKINLPKNIIAKKVYTTLEITTNKIKKQKYYIELDNEVFLPNDRCISVVEECNVTNNDCTRIDSKDVVLPLYVRTRKTGDKIQIKNMKGHKKIKDIFIDEKTPAEERDSWPIVIDSRDKVIWIPGLKKSDFDKEKDEKYDIIIKYI